MINKLHYVFLATLLFNIATVENFHASTTSVTSSVVTETDSPTSIAPIFSVYPEITIDEQQTNDNAFSDQQLLSLFHYYLLNSGVDGNDDVTVQLSSSEEQVLPVTIDYTAPGDYSIWFHVTNSAGLESVKEGHLIINDIMPTLTILDDTKTVYTDSQPLSPLDDFFVTATEFTSGDLNSQITADATAVDYSTPGDYPIDFSVADGDGNTVTDTATVTVVQDPISSPIFSVSDHTVNEIEHTNNYIYPSDVIETLLGYNLISSGDPSSDDVSLTLSSQPDKQVPVEIFANTPGSYPVYITATNNQGRSTTKLATFTIRDLKPKISFEQPNVTVEPNHDNSDFMYLFGPTATEVTAGDYTDQVTFDDSHVNYSANGSYPVSFSVTDDEGNTTTEIAALSVRGVETHTSPTFTVEDKTITETVASSTLSDSQVLSLINYHLTSSGDSKPSEATVKLSSNATGTTPLKINTSVPGSYTVYVTVTNSFGESSLKHANLTITDKMPKITANSNSQTITTGMTNTNLINLFNVQASEFKTSDLNSRIKVSQSINFNKAGSYPVTFSVTDDEKNTVKKTVTLVVKEKANSTTCTWTKSANSNHDGVNYCNLNGKHVKASKWTNGYISRKTAYDTHGKVDYKWEYDRAGNKTSYEDWSNGHRTQLNTYAHGKVTSKTKYDTHGNKTSYEGWNNGHKVQVNSYAHGKVASKTKYDTHGNKTSYEKWEGGHKVQVNTYSQGKVTKKTFYNTKGKVIRVEKWHNGKLVEIK